MKPTFALDLTRETIGLLHRTPKGWLSIGEVAFDAPDLPEAMDYLRKTALGLSPLGVATKLILPNSQILYTEITAPGPSREDKRRQIAEQLEGRTPYDVADLVFDWSGKGATVKVAVIARETLEQAESFAVEHRLNPVSFVAIPEEGTFVGEPWFGPTAAAATLLAEDEKVDRDREPVTILHRELPKAEPEAATEAPEVQPEPEARPEPSAVQDKAPPASPAEEELPGLAEALNADLPEEAAQTPAAVEDAPVVAEPVADEPASAAPVEDLPEPEATLAREAAGTAAPVAAAATTPVRAEAPAAEPAPVAASPSQPAEPEEAPFAHVTDTSAFPEGDDLPTAPTAKKLVVDDLDDDVAPPPPPAPGGGGSGTGAGGEQAIKKDDTQ
jgi:hypothetical protein